jgi:uncharacterized C2H2 Zn-finger protein
LCQQLGEYQEQVNATLSSTDKPERGNNGSPSSLPSTLPNDTRDQGRVCWQCNASFKSHLELENHAAKDQYSAYICVVKDCKQTFRRRDTYLRHISTAHITNPAKMWRCDKCEMGFKRKDGLVTHQRHARCGRPAQETYQSSASDHNSIDHSMHASASSASSSAPNQAPAVTRFGGDEDLSQGRPDPLAIVGTHLHVGNVRDLIEMLDEAIDKNDYRKRHEVAAALVHLVLLSFEYMRPEIKMQIMDILNSPEPNP